MIVLEVGVYVAFPVELLDQVIKVLMMLLGHVLDQKLPGHGTAFDQGLIHAEHVGAPLGLIGDEGAGGVQDAWGNQPACPRLETIGLAEIENAVITLVPALQTAA